MQCSAISFISNAVSMGKFYVLNIFAQNIDSGYTLANEYPKSMFLSKIKINRFTTVNPISTMIVGYIGVFLAWTCLHDVVSYM